MCFSWKKKCKDLTRECSIFSNHDVGMCVCKSEYLGFGENCLEGNLKINQTCERNEQCNAAQNLECQNGKCTCRDMNVLVNETDCKPVEINGKAIGKMFLNQEQASFHNQGLLIGLIIFGLLVITLTVIVIVQAIHNMKTNKRYKMIMHICCLQIES
ncbi:uncharacterized protein LOC134257460 [Saccostrea cucullata]|uniref:uncharacterized protein LOC134257460 n=1 Tax=Saccostrea cuccullata TaxID=36930 RepID=UPI002ED374AE